jgi:hypothetical protein
MGVRANGERERKERLTFQMNNVCTGIYVYTQSIYLCITAVLVNMKYDSILKPTERTKTQVEITANAIGLSVMEND